MVSAEQLTGNGFPAGGDYPTLAWVRSGTTPTCVDVRSGV